MKLERYLPLGMEKKPVIRWLLGGAVLGAAFDLFFFNSYGDAKESLHDWPYLRQLRP